MCTNLTCIAIMLVGAIAGIIGHLGEAGPITRRSSLSASTTGAMLSIIVYSILISFFPEFPGVAVACGAFTGLTRWSLVSPVINCVLKVVYSLIFIIIQKKVK